MHLQDIAPRDRQHADLEAFLRDHRGDSRAGKFEKRVTIGKRPVRPSAWMSARDLSAVSDAIRASANTGNVLIGSALRRGRSKRDTDSLDGSLLSVDLDSDEALDALDRFPIPPSWVIASGGLTAGGRRRLNAHWVLTEPLAPEPRKALQARVRDHLHGDGDFTGNVLRPPGTLNHNYNPPRPVEVIPFKGIAPGTSRYGWREIERHLPDKSRKQEPMRERVGAPPDLRAAIDAELETAAFNIASGAGRNPSGFALACTLRDLGLDEADREPILRDFAVEIQERWPRDHSFTVAEILDSNRSASTRKARRLKVTPPGLDAWGERAIETVKRERPRSRTLPQLVIRFVELAREHRDQSVIRSERKLASDIQRNDNRIGPALGDLEALGLIRKDLDEESRSTRITLRILKRDRDAEQRGASGPTPPTEPLPSCSLAPLLSPLPLDHDAQAFFAHGQGYPILLSLSQSPFPLTIREIAKRACVHPRTARRQTQRLARHGIVREVEAGRWEIDNKDFEIKLDEAAAHFSTAGRAIRVHLRHDRHRRAYETAMRLAPARKLEREAKLLRRFRTPDRPTNCVRRCRRRSLKGPSHVSRSDQRISPSYA